MRKAWTLLVLSVLIGGTGLLASSQEAAASFHVMRVYGVMGGAGGNANVQYVELRMPDPGQHFLFSGSVGTAALCFFDAGGAVYARFKFPADVANGADEASILVGTSEFDTSWAAGSPDFTFSAANTVAVAGGADVAHPVRAPAGKVSFGTDNATVPGSMCASGFSVIDSVAYGTGYSGPVTYGTKLNQDLPTAGFQGAKVQGPPATNQANGTLCSPASFLSSCLVVRDNSVDYTIVNTNGAGNEPRNNSNQSGQVGDFDADGDGVPDATDNCLNVANPGQENADGDALGDACDPDADNDGYTNVAESGTPVCAGAVNDDDGDDGLTNDGCPAVGAPESTCTGAVDEDADGFVNDGCPQAGSFSEASFKLGTNDLGPCGAGSDPGPSPSWPPDLVGGGSSIDKITLVDITSFVAPAPKRLNTSPGDPGFSSRWDLVPGRGVAAKMIVLNDLTAIVAGATSTPPMFSGAKIFNGPTCTGP